MADLLAKYKATLWRPTITVWNRLEGRTRAEDFDRAMKAEVHDALWMLSRQWQMGEFIGDDAGSPVLAKAHISTTMINKYKPGDGPVQQFDNNVPIEAKVEHQAIPFKQGGQDIGLDIRLLMGRQWLKWLATVDSTLKQDYIDEYEIRRPDPDIEADARICAHVKVWQQFAAVAGRQMDGYQLYQYLKMSPANHAYDAIPAVDDDIRKNAIDNIALKFINWYEKLYYQPIEVENTSWRPEYLEYQFSCSAPEQDSEKVMVAQEYYHGHLDWYNLDMEPDQTGLGDVETGEDLPDEDLQPGAITRSFIPSSVTFGGMPHSRWWKFENWQTDLSFIKPDTTDLNKLLLLDFMLVYSNDWFLVPFTLPTGSIANVKGLSVKNVFGEHIWVEPAGAGPDEDWQRWNMYSLNIKGDDDIPADLSLVVLPAAKKVLEGKLLEEIFLLRDEVANMVWGVESQVPLATGKSMPGKQAGYELRNKLQQLIVGEPPETELLENDAKIRYQVVNSVPEQWIPLTPVHLNNNMREIQLQRASMPRILENDPGIPMKIEPRTSILREGLDQDDPQPYFLHEEEVPKAGIQIRKSFQRTRWFDGKVYTWIGIRKQVGRGGGSSGLAFDQIIPVNNK